MTPKPYFREIWLACRQCGHKWDDWQPCDVLIERWVAYVRAFRCPNCSADDGVLIRSKPLTEASDQC
jgi:DNA-directed RNA polymerase subunit RPC12/RpoP